jgi:hypothetical protein
MSVNTSWLSIASEASRAAEQTPVPLAGPPSSGNGSSAEPTNSQLQTSTPGTAQDEVKVQLEPPGEIAVYRFVNQQGALILQVPPQEVINLAQEIAQELAQETAPRESAGGTGEKNNGH